MPLSLHLETLGGIATPLVLRGTPLPATRSEFFSTADDDQTTVEIKVLLGESPLAAKNRSLGVIRLTGIPPAPRGKPQIQVTFSVDRRCQITASASAEDQALKVVSDPIDPLRFLSPAGIHKAIKRAELMKEQDQTALQEIEVRASADAAIVEAEKVLATAQSKATPGVNTQRISDLIATLGLAMEVDQIEEIRSAVQALKDAVHPPFDVASLGGFGGLFGSHLSTSKPERPTKGPAGGVNPKAKKSDLEPGHDAAPTATRTPLGQVFGGGTFSLDPSLCFVLMPFADTFRAFYEDNVRKVITQAGLSCQRADEIASTNLITWDIWERINRARFIIADLTNRNPNVFYEVGLAHAISKSVILLTRTMSDVPFDLRNLRCIVYDYTPRGMAEFEPKLAAAINAVMKSV